VVVVVVVVVVVAAVVVVVVVVVVVAVRGGEGGCGCSVHLSTSMATSSSPEYVAASRLYSPMAQACTYKETSVTCSL
jgi:hypothetical protein